MSRLVTNSALVVSYSVFTFQRSPDCISALGKQNLTNWFNAAFVGGFSLNLANFVYHGFVEPVGRKIKLENKGGIEEYSPRQGYYLIVSYVLNMLLQVSIYVASAL